MSSFPLRGGKFDNYEFFCELLHDRLHGLLVHFEDLASKSLMIHMDLLPRHQPELCEQKVFFLAGSKSQRKILETDVSFSDEELRQLTPHWQFLSRKNLESKTPGLRTNQMVGAFEQGRLSLRKVEKGTLADYFSHYWKHGEHENVFQEHEFPIFSKLFNTEPGGPEDGYLSVPLIQFGQIEGVVHILLAASEKKRIYRREAVKRIIKLFSAQYEELLLAWDAIGINRYEHSEFSFYQLLTTQGQAKVQDNPILTELDFKRFYRISEPYYRARIEFNNDGGRELRRYARNYATIAILVDSYSHNISAHSLTALNWLFQQQPNKESIPGKIITNDQDLLHIGELQEDLRALSQSQSLPPNIFLKKDHSSNKALAPLFKFLMEKGAFWTGVARGNTFGGQLINLGEVLWTDFFNNPLYLGTIAFSEGIRKLQVSIIIYEKVDSSEGFNVRRKVARNADGQNLAGEYVTIDLFGGTEQIGAAYEAEFPDLMAERSEFVVPGPKFIPLHQHLNQIQIFLPGGVVGKHALFTLIENELRNVKHFEEEALEDMREEGLQLVLSFMPKPIFEGQPQDALYEVGIWLNHATQLRRKGDEPLIIRRFDGANQDIIETHTLKPRLGGTVQDKLCAAMLFNNDFQQVQKRESKRDKSYQPWVWAASALLDEPHEDFLLNFVQTEEARQMQNQPALLADFLQSVEDQYEHHHEQGIIKKYIHLWQGDEIFFWTADQAQQHTLWEEENVSRFKYLVSQNPTLGKTGIIRTISAAENLEEARKAWLARWIPKATPHLIHFKMGPNDWGGILRTQDELSFIPKKSLVEDDTYDELPAEVMLMAHGGSNARELNACHYRNHGIFATRFCGPTRKMSHLKDMPLNLLHDLYETIKTEVAIFDSRIYKRIDPNRRSFFQNQLHVSFVDEDEVAWDHLKTERLPNIHFLVLHLSFIEKLTDRGGYRYGEKRIVDFIEEEVYPHIIDRANFILAITTGRGRRDWWEGIIGSPYMHFTTFRPIESLISAVEAGIQKKDDFDLKYHLLKVLFGS